MIVDKAETQHKATGDPNRPLCISKVQHPLYVILTFEEAQNVFDDDIPNYLHNHFSNNQPYNNPLQFSIVLMC